MPEGRTWGEQPGGVQLVTRASSKPRILGGAQRPVDLAFADWTDFDREPDGDTGPQSPVPGYARPVHSDDALDQLLGMLDAAGVNRAVPTLDDVGRTWAVMREFARESVEDADPPSEDGDMFLAQYGTYESGVRGPETFELDITRQFIFSTDGEYDHMAQLNCTFSFEPTPENRLCGEDNLWQDGPSDAFFDRALAMPGFAVAATTPLSLSIDYSPV